MDDRWCKSAADGFGKIGHGTGAGAEMGAHFGGGVSIGQPFNSPMVTAAVKESLAPMLMIPEDLANAYDLWVHGMPVVISRPSEGHGS
jgi:hypothetical protein